MKSDNAVFYGLLGLLVWTPLPLGSNRTWAWVVLVIWSCLLTSVWLIGYLRGFFVVTPAFWRARFALAVGALWLLYVGLALLALPANWVRVLSVHAYDAHAVASAALGHPVADALTLSVDPHITRAFWFKSVAYGCIFGLTLLVVNSRHRLELLLQTLVFSGTLQALYASVMVLSGLEYSFFIKKFTNQGLATGTFVNRNNLAGYLNVCLAMGMGLMISKLGGGQEYGWRHQLRSVVRLLLGPKTRLRIYLIIMVIGLILTRSRMGNTAFFVSTLIVGAIGLLLMRHAPRSAKFFLASVIALDMLIVGTWFGVDQVTKRIQATEVTTNTNNLLPTEDRDEVDQQAWIYAKDYLQTGSGGGTFYVTFPAYSSHSIVGFFDQAHNDYMQMLTETGVIGLTLCVLIVLMAIQQSLSAMRQRNDPLMRGAAFGVTFAVCWLAIHSTVDFNMQIPANALTMTVVLALAWVSASVQDKDQQSPVFRIRTQGKPASWGLTDRPAQVACNGRSVPIRPSVD